MFEMHFKEALIDAAESWQIDPPSHVWALLEKEYVSKKRHYHTLQHLEACYQQLVPVLTNFKSKEALLFALAFHDYIYKIPGNHNEELSAEAAIAFLKRYSVASAHLEWIDSAIRKTKTHDYSHDESINLFTDADMAILGAEASIYIRYKHAVRKEYALYPDFLYKPGRKKVLQAFLEKPRIYHTSYFYDKFEKQARSNIAAEIATL